MRATPGLKLPDVYAADRYRPLQALLPHRWSQRRIRKIEHQTVGIASYA